MLFLPAATAAQECDCSATFESMVSKVDQNYLALRMEGYPREYKEVTRRIRQHTVGADLPECLALLEEWIEMFDDGHLFVISNPSLLDDQIAELAATAEVHQTPGARLLSYLESEAPKDSIEGLWYTAGGEHIMAVVRDSTSVDRDFVGVLLETDNENWQPGQVKAEFVRQENKYSMIRYRDNHSPHYTRATINRGDLLVVYGDDRWGRLDPRADLDSALGDPSAPKLERYDDDTWVLSIASHSFQYRAVIDSLLSANAEQIAAADLLIVDLRGDTGGSSLTTSPLQPFFYTQDMMDNPPPRIRPGYVVASEDNLAYYRAAARRSGGNPPEWLARLVSNIEASPGELVIDFDSATIASFGPNVPDTMYAGPTDIGIIMDRNNASAAEAFILDAAVSSRVTLFGENTFGMIDYQNVAITRLESCPAHGFLLGYPVRSSTTVLPEGGHNRTGLIPDVRIPASVDDWVGFVAEYEADSDE